MLLNFFFTSCGDTCPLVTENLREVQDILGERMGRDIFMVSVSLQPELETPAILHDYAAQWEVRPGWRFVTGRPDDIEQLRRATGFADVSPEYAVVRDSHTGLLRYGNDRLKRWAGTTGSRPAGLDRQDGPAHRRHGLNGRQHHQVGDKIMFGLNRETKRALELRAELDAAKLAAGSWPSSG